MGSLSRRGAAALAASIFAVSSGCGGGGSSGQDGGGQLGFRLLWQQRSGASAAARSGSARSDAAGPSDGGSAAGFAETIPPSVSAIRFIVTPTDDPAMACCVAILRGSAAFEERSLVIGGLTGEITLDVSGYPDQAPPPSDGIPRTCSTTTPPVEGVVACSGPDYLTPSYGADPVTVTVVPANVTDAGDINLYSRPFLIGLEPPPGGSVQGTRPLLYLSVVDATQPVDQGIDVSVDVPSSSNPVAVAQEQLTACNDRVIGQECSAEGALDVAGFALTGRPDSPLDLGSDWVHVLAHNNGEPPRMLDTSYEIFVTEVGTTTTTVTSTSTSTTSTSTTTTTVLDMDCSAVFRLDDEVGVESLQWDTNYANAPGKFAGSAGEVECSPLEGAGDAANFWSANDKDSKKILTVAMTGIEGFMGPVDIFECRFLASEMPAPSDFAITVVDAAHPGGTTIDPLPAVTVKVSCGGSSTTTTTQGQTTTTQGPTTTTQGPVTTTTLPSAGSFYVAFSLTNAVKFGALGLDVGYQNAPGEFTGTAEAVTCYVGACKLSANDGTPCNDDAECLDDGSGSQFCNGYIPASASALAAFNDKDAQRILSLAWASAKGVQGPRNPLVTCRFDAQSTPEPANFPVTITDAKSPTGVPLDPGPTISVTVTAIP